MLSVRPNLQIDGYVQVNGLHRSVQVAVDLARGLGVEAFVENFSGLLGNALAVLHVLHVQLGKVALVAGDHSVLVVRGALT